MQQPTPQPQVLLVELLDLDTEDLFECDVTAHLQNALESVFVYLADYNETITPEVSIASDGELEGIAFFGPNEQQLAFITVYYLERDQPSCEFDGLRELVARPLAQLDEGLKALFR
jgi:hypothetical protein